MPATPETTRKAREAINKVLEGAAIARAVVDVGLSLAAFHEAMAGERELAASYARAQEIRADVLVDEALAAADSEDDPAKVRNRVDIRKWAAAKFNQRKFGERIDVNVQQSISIDVALGEAKQRLLRPVCDQLTVSDANTIDLPSVVDFGAGDAQSPGLPISHVPDIFS